MRFRLLIFTLMIILLPMTASAEQTLPVPGTVTMIDLGSNSCIPCKLMAPILDKLTLEYEGRAAIVFIDVVENPEEKANYNIQAIPTQIFYDREGREIRRHQGFYSEESIRMVLDALLAR